jgi:hypothetical protein
MKRPLFSSLGVLFGIALTLGGASSSFAALQAPAAAGEVLAHGVAKVMLGQEFAYSGTAEWKQSRSRGPALASAGAVKIAATVSEADPQKGYAVIVMRGFEPQKRPGQPNFPAEVEVTTVRYGADLTSTASGAGPHSPIGELFPLLSVPLTPGTGLKPGEQWRHSESLPEMPAPVPLVYAVTGHAHDGDRDCLQIEKKLAQALPFKPGGGGAPELTDYGQTLCVDPESGLVVSQQVHQQVRFPTEEGPITIDLSASISLQQTRQLPDMELAARIRQAAALDRAQRAVFLFRPGVDRRKTLAEASKEIAAFRKEFPASPYAPALAHLDEQIGQMRSAAEREARLQRLQGKPAPAFTLKNLAGSERTLGAYRGKIILLNFFASW